MEKTRAGEFLNGMKDTIPLILGAIPFGIIFGAVSVTESGLSPAETMGLSLFVFAGSAQFIAAGLVAQGTGIGIIVLTTFIVNLRHALYSASLAPYMKHLSQRWLLPLGFWLTDETYAVVIRRYPADDSSPYKHWYHLGSSVFMYTNWQLVTLIGILTGQQLENAAQWGLDFAMVVTFIGIIVPLIINRPMLACAVSAGLTAVLARSLPNNLGLMVAAVVGIGVGYGLEVWQKRGTLAMQAHRVGEAGEERQ
ncbi:MAG: AzlC family ABC transporter permease [Anaerolineae bacterium]